MIRLKLLHKIVRNPLIIGISLSIVFLFIYPAIINAQVEPVYRFWSARNQSHFFTKNVTEKDMILLDYDSSTWDLEGISFAVPSSSNANSKPVYRFWSAQNQTHFFTISQSEKQLIESSYPENIWRYEGVAYNAYTNPSGNGESTKPVYRFWSAANQSHFYTVSQAEKDLIINTYPEFIWKYEGIAYYVPAESAGIYVRTTDPIDVSNSFGNWDFNKCPVTSQKCVPCNASDSRCRIESGQTTGYLGWACQNNNPGNIRYSEFRNSLITEMGGEPACGSRGTFMVFRDPTIGNDSLQAYIRAVAAGKHSSYPECGDCSLKYFFSRYAPAGDQNNPTSYANNVASWIGANADTTTLNWVVENKLPEFAEAIQRQEGWFEE